MTIAAVIGLLVNFNPALELGALGDAIMREIGAVAAGKKSFSPHPSSKEDIYNINLFEEGECEGGKLSNAIKTRQRRKRKLAEIEPVDLLQLEHDMPMDYRAAWHGFKVMAQASRPSGKIYDTTLAALLQSIQQRCAGMSDAQIAAGLNKATIAGAANARYVFLAASSAGDVQPTPPAVKREPPREYSPEEYAQFCAANGICTPDDFADVQPTLTPRQMVAAISARAHKQSDHIGALASLDDSGYTAETVASGRVKDMLSGAGHQPAPVTTEVKE